MIVVIFLEGGRLVAFLLCDFFLVEICFVLSTIIFIMMLFDKWLLILVIN